MLDTEPYRKAMVDKAHQLHVPIPKGFEVNAHYMLGPVARPFLWTLLKAAGRPPTVFLTASVREWLIPVAPGAKALKKAQGEIGYRESPAGSNMTKYGAWYGLNGESWCAMFQSWCFTMSGRALHYAYVPFIIQDAQNKHNGLEEVAVPKPGDLVCYLWRGWTDPNDSHVGIFESGTEDVFTAVEGNTSFGNNSNGGAVMRRDRERKDAALVVFVRVNRV